MNSLLNDKSFCAALERAEEYACDFSATAEVVYDAVHGYLVKDEEESHGYAVVGGFGTSGAWYRGDDGAEVSI